MLKALTAALGFALVAHSPTLTAAIIPAAVVFVAGQGALLVHLARRGSTR